MNLFHKKKDKTKTHTAAGKTTKDIWQIEDANTFVMAMDERVCRKCKNGRHMQALSAQERIFYITQLLEKEVNNGGFAQFFYNTSGNFTNEIHEAFLSIGAVKTAALCQKAIDVFQAPLPEDKIQREAFLEPFLEDDAVTDALDDLDTAFYQYEEDLSALACAFVRNNQAQFSD